MRVLNERGDIFVLGQQCMVLQFEHMEWNRSHKD